MLFQNYSSIDRPHTVTLPDESRVGGFMSGPAGIQLCHAAVRALEATRYRTSPSARSGITWPLGLLRPEVTLAAGGAAGGREERSRGVRRQPTPRSENARVAARLTAARSTATCAAARPRASSTRSAGSYAGGAARARARGEVSPLGGAADGLDERSRGVRRQPAPRSEVARTSARLRAARSTST